MAGQGHLRVSSEFSRTAPIFLTVNEAAALLRITTRSVYQMIAEKRIPYRRVGRAVRFERTELMNWTKAQTATRSDESE
jgi:excisionase family DNA binding protein